MKTSFKSITASTEYAGICSLQRNIMAYIWKHNFQGKWEFNIQTETHESLEDWQTWLSTTGPHDLFQ